MCIRTCSVNTVQPNRSATFCFILLHHNTAKKKRIPFTSLCGITLVALISHLLLNMNTKLCLKKKGSHFTIAWGPIFTINQLLTTFFFLPQ